MPRDGSGIFSKPFPDVVAGTTVESAVHNGIVADFTTDANAARPVIAGGTGATSAKNARDNLDAAVAGALVTNFDSHVWENGSFYTNPDVSGGPVAGHAFTGVSIVHADPQHITVEARDILDTMVPGTVYVRQKRSGVWGVWTRTSSVVMSATGGLAGISGETADMFFGVIGTSPSSSFVVNSESDVTGVNYLQVNRTPGNVVCNVNLDVMSGRVVSQAPVGASADFLLRDDVGAFKGILKWERADNSVFIGHAAGQNIRIPSSGSVQLAAGLNGRQGTGGSITPADVHNFWWDSALIQCWINATFVGQITFVSDYRIKKDVADLPGQWETVKALRPVKYTQAQYTPQVEMERLTKEAAAGGEVKPMFAADNVERWGFIAHELQETLIPNAATGTRDAPDVVQSPNPWTVIAALTSALQEAMARIEALEAQLAAPS